MSMTNPSSHPQSGPSPLGGIAQSLISSWKGRSAERRSQQFQIGMAYLKHQLGEQSANNQLGRDMALSSHEASLVPAKQASAQEHEQRMQDSRQQHEADTQRREYNQDRWSFRNREKPVMDWAQNTLNQGTPEQQQAAAHGLMTQAGNALQPPPSQKKPGPKKPPKPGGTP